MILVTGGSGFIGSHTVRALHGLGEPSVVMQRRSGQVPPYLADLPVVAEQADVADLDSLRAIGERGLRPVLQREVRVLEEIAEHVVTRADLARCFRTRPRHPSILSVG